MITLKNNTKATSIVGKIVATDPSDNNGFIYASANSTHCLGVVTEAVPFRSLCRIATRSDRAEVMVQGGAVRGSILRSAKSTDRISLGMAVLAKTTDSPYLRIGEALNTSSSLVSCILELTYANAGATDHGTLDGLSDNDHPQYAMADHTHVSLPFQNATFANPLNLDATTHKDFKCSSVTGNTIVNLNNAVDGDAGMIELIIDGTGGYTVSMGTMFTKKMGDMSINTTASADNIISWRKVGSDVIYTVGCIE